MLVGEKGTSHFARTVTPRRDKPGRDVGGLLTGDLAQVSKLPERDIVLDRWDVVKLFPDGGVLNVLIDDLTHFDMQNSPNPPVQKNFEGVKKSLPGSPALVAPKQKVTQDGLE